MHRLSFLHYHRLLPHKSSDISDHLIANFSEIRLRECLLYDLGHIHLSGGPELNIAVNRYSPMCCPPAVCVNTHLGINIRRLSRHN